MKRNYWIEIISSLFILLFVYTAVTKFSDFHRFRNVLHGSPLIREKSTIVAWMIPLSEIAISTLLFFPKTRKVGMWGSLLLMVLFTGYITYIAYFSDIVPCSCGGIIEKMTWNQHLIFNIVFTLLAAIGLWLISKKNRNVEMPFQYSASA